MKKEKFVYDRTLREIFQTIPKGMIKLLTGSEPKELLDTSFPKVEEKEADIIVKLENGDIFHLEIQLRDDKDMPKRMLYYYLLIEKVHKKIPKQMVLYLAEDKDEITHNIKNKNLNFSYEIKYISDIDCQTLIESEDINDNILSILCSVKDINKLLSRLSNKLQKLDEKKKEDYIRKLIYLFRLRPKLYDIIDTEQKEEFKMPFVIEKEIDPFYKEGVKKGLEKGQHQEKLAIASSLLDILDDKTISERVKLPLEKVKALREKSEK
jgi:predicted transposase/invertase (TIGR01784 family)